MSTVTMVKALINQARQFQLILAGHGQRLLQFVEGVLVGGHPIFAAETPAFRPGRKPRLQVVV